MSATQKPALALCAPGSPKVHIQGNLSIGFKENGDRPGKDAPHSGLGPAPLYVGPNFLLLTELVWMRATGRPVWLREQPGSSGSPDTQVGSFNTRLCKDVYGELNTPGSPSGFWEPCCSCSLRATFSQTWPPRLVPGLSGLGRAGELRRRVQRMYIQLPETLPVSWTGAQGKLSPAGWNGRGPAWSWHSGEGCTSLLCLLDGGSWASRGHSHSPCSLSLVVFQTFMIIFPRLIDQSPDARNLKSPVAQG